MTTAQTITGKARILIVQDRTITGVARVNVTTVKTITGVANISTGTTKTITGKARIKAAASQTITGKARITKTGVAQTISGLARIEGTALKTITGKARISGATMQTIMGVARIKASTSQTITGKARIAGPGSSNTNVFAAAAPRLTVALGSFDIGETNGCILSSEYDLERNSITGSFYCEFHCRLTNGKKTGVIATDDVIMSNYITALEAALRIPRQALVVNLGGAPLVNWTYTSAGQTAILLQPELTLIEENARDFRYGLRVRCQFVDNTVGNGYRRESVTTIGTSMRERRTCTIGATWTSSPNVTAYAQYLAAGAESFFTAQLPPVSTDQYGTTGAWQLASQVPQYNDENSIINATREYWEVFGGRRDSAATLITTIGDRRVCVIPGVWTATTGFSALQNYANANYGEAYFLKVLGTVATPVTNGSWVKVDEEPTINDQNTILTVTRTYHEVVNGLRDYDVECVTEANGLRTLTVSGTFYTTHAGSAKAAYVVYADGVVTAARLAESPVFNLFEGQSVPKFTRYNQNAQTLFFRHVIRELAYPQSLNATNYDDPNITYETLDLNLSRPYDQQSITSANPVTRLQTGTARFVAVINTKSQGGDNPVVLWDDKFKAHVVRAIQSKLGAAVAGVAASVEVVDEQVGVGLHSNQLMGTLSIIVGGGSVLWVRLRQRVTQIPGRDPVGMGDGEAFSVFTYRVSPEKLLKREGSCEWVVGSTPPVLFASGDNTVSGFGFIDTGVTAQADVDAQNASTAYAPAGSWMVDRRAGDPYAYDDDPTDRGDGTTPFQTVVHRQVENWRYVLTLRDSA